jgi:prepilin-type N-terminal cleavage/methylation domain-containing protein
MPRRQLEHGFSLVELVVTVAILTVVMGAAFMLMTRSQTSFDANQSLAEAHQNADFAVNRITELIRGAGSNPDNIGTVDWLDFLNYVNDGDKTSIHIMSDLNGDGDFIDDVSEEAGAQYFIMAAEDVYIQYNETDRTLELVNNVPGADTTPVTLAEHILFFEVELYRDMDGNENFKEARVTVEAGPSRAIDAEDPRFRTFTTQSEIRLRNR